MPTTQTHLQNVTDALISPIADRVGNVIAVGAITLPWWRGEVKFASEVAGDILPILGVIWLVVQIFFRVFGKKAGD
jgi:hypothetical protein